MKPVLNNHTKIAQIKFESKLLTSMNQRKSLNVVLQPDHSETSNSEMKC